MDTETLAFLAQLENENRMASNNAELVPSGERLCPICQTAMAVEVTQGVNIDVCAQHGIWLDSGELPAMLSAARSSERVGVSQRVRQARQDGKVSGTLLGAWSFLLD